MLYFYWEKVMFIVDNHALKPRLVSLGKQLSELKKREICRKIVVDNLRKKVRDIEEWKKEVYKHTEKIQKASFQVFKFTEGALSEKLLK